MKKIIVERGQGKTTELLKMSAEKNVPILVMTKWEYRFLMDKATDMELAIPEPVFLDKIRGTTISEVLIDEADQMLRLILSERGIDIIAMTLSPEEDKYTMVLPTPQDFPSTISARDAANKSKAINDLNARRDGRLSMVEAVIHDIDESIQRAIESGKYRATANTIFRGGWTNSDSETIMSHYRNRGYKIHINGSDRYNNMVYISWALEW